MLTGTPFLSVFRRLDDDAHSRCNVASPAVCAQVRIGGDELVEQVPVRAVNLYAVESCKADGPQRRSAEAFDDVRAAISRGMGYWPSPR